MAAYASRVQRIAAWCDQAELWIAGLPFVAQLLVVLAILLPAAFAIAWMLDSALTMVVRLARGSELRRLRRARMAPAELATKSAPAEPAAASAAEVLVPVGELGGK